MFNAVLALYAKAVVDVLIMHYTLLRGIIKILDHWQFVHAVLM